jgi:SAM-dependent MidA family methyltransferase
MQIQEGGPMPFEVFHSAALYGPGGFYSSDTIRSSKAGDFLTSPEVSPLFGEALAVLVEQEIERVGPDGFTLVEVAGGSGSLLQPLLGKLGAIDCWAVEVNPAARRQLRDLIGRDQVISEVSALPRELKGVVIANELLDNLPVAIATQTADGWRELWVGEEGGRLTLVDAPPRPEVVAWCDSFGLPCPDGGVVEVQLAASEWVGEMVRRLGSGTLVLIDYGEETENLESRRSDGTLRTYRSHRRDAHPLDAPGTADITADVNFTAMARAAVDAGGAVELLRQDEFLSRLGLRSALSNLRKGALQAARDGNTMLQLRLKSEARAVETLMAPRGLGEFKVLLVTK